MGSEVLDIFLEIANWKIEEKSSGPSVYAGQLYRYVEFLQACQTSFEMELTTDEQQKNITKWLSGNDAVSRQFLKDIKKNVTNIIDDFHELKNLQADNPINVSIVYGTGNPEPLFRFSINTNKPDDSEILLIAFLNLVAGLKLEPDRFQTCPKCTKRFYQANRKSMKYCSKACSNSGRSGQSIS